MIDWEEVAKRNDMKPKELEKDVLTACAVMGVLRIDTQDKFEVFRFTCRDEVGKIELTVRRVQND